jgi:hypothetical protein
LSDGSDPNTPVDWKSLVAELQGLAFASLGRRSKPVIIVLLAADHSETGIEAAINQIESMRLLFVDPIRLGDLAYEMRTRLAGRVGKSLPPRQSRVSGALSGLSSDPGVTSAFVAGCQGTVLFGLSLVLAAILVAASVLAHVGQVAWH